MINGNAISQLPLRKQNMKLKKLLILSKVLFNRRKKKRRRGGGEISKLLFHFVWIAQFILRGAVSPFEAKLKTKQPIFAGSSPSCFCHLTTLWSQLEKLQKKNQQPPKKPADHSLFVKAVFVAACWSIYPSSLPCDVDCCLSLVGCRAPSHLLFLKDCAVRSSAEYRYSQVQSRPQKNQISSDTC